jgi:hypothetical protein
MSINQYQMVDKYLTQCSNAVGRVAAFALLYASGVASISSNVPHQKKHQEKQSSPQSSKIKK